MNPRSTHEKTPRRHRYRERGSILSSLAGSLAVAAVAVAGVGSLFVDMAGLYTSRAQLRIAATAAALAGVRELAAADPRAARERAVAVAEANELVGDGITVDPNSGVQFGRWADGRFSPDDPRANAVRVTVARDRRPESGPLSRMFGPAIVPALGRMLGEDAEPVRATALARLEDVDVTLVLDASAATTRETQYSSCTRWLDDGTCGCGHAPGGYEPIDSMRRASGGFVAQFDAEVDRVGLVAFSDDADVVQPLTGALWRVQSAIDEIPPRTHCRVAPVADLASGLDRGLSVVTGAGGREHAAKILVLVSYGAGGCGGDAECVALRSELRSRALSIARRAAEAGVVVHTIGLGESADRGILAEIAESTGGELLRARSVSELPSALHDVRRRIPLRLAS